MKKNFTNKKFHNYFSGVTLKLCLVLSQLFLIPAYIKHLGIDVYGEWLILTTVPNYLLLSDLGLTLTVTNEICRLINLKEYDAQKKLYKSNLSFLSIIGVGLLVSFFIVIPFVDFTSLFNLESISNYSASLILGGFMVNVLFSLIFRVTIGYFKALNLFHKHEYFLAFTLFLDFLATLIILKIKAPLYYIPISMALIRMFLIFLINKILLKIDYYSVGFVRDFKPAMKLIPVSLKLSFFQLGSALFIQGCTMLVGVILGAASVVVFNTIRVLVNSLKAFIGILYVPTMQEFTILLTKNQKKKAYVKIKKLLLLIFSISLISCFGIYIMRDFIFELWIKEPFIYNKLFLVFMLISVLLHNVWNAGSMLPVSVNKLNELAIYPILGILLLTIQYFFLEKTNLVGLAISFVIIDFIMLVLVLKASLNVLKTNKAKALIVKN